jgi:hypothetical protein
VTPERKWYVLLRNGDFEPIGLLGPMKQGREGAELAVASMTATDRLLTDQIDWDSETVTSPYFYHSLHIMDLTPAECAQLVSSPASV